MIGRKTRQRQQQKMRSELERHHDADCCCVMVCQLREDDPVLGNALHPRTDIGYNRPAGPDAIVVAVQRTKGAFYRHLCVPRGIAAVKSSEPARRHDSGKKDAQSQSCGLFPGT